MAGHGKEAYTLIDRLGLIPVSAVVNDTATIEAGLGALATALGRAGSIEDPIEGLRAYAEVRRIAKEYLTVIRMADESWDGRICLGPGCQEPIFDATRRAEYHSDACRLRAWRSRQRNVRKERGE